MFDWDDSREIAENEVSYLDVLNQVTEKMTADEIYNETIKGYREEEFKKYFNESGLKEYDKELILDFLELDINNPNSEIIQMLLDSKEYELEVNKIFNSLKDSYQNERDVDFDWRSSR